MDINKIYNEDCLIGMQKIPDKSIDMILCDLPYGTSACSWDSVIPIQKLWEHYLRILKPTGTIVLFGSEPFSSVVRNSNLTMYKYDWKWVKPRGANFLNAKFQPLKNYEDVMVFSNCAASFSKKGNSMKYNPIMATGIPYTCVSGKQKQEKNNSTVRSKIKSVETVSDGKRYPKSILEFSPDKEKVHPTQKPVALCEYLIKTYTDEGEAILDNCIGSGTTAIACLNTKRNFIGFEKDKEYFKKAIDRIEKHKVQISLFQKSLKGVNHERI